MTTIRVDLLFKIIPDGIIMLSDEGMMPMETCEEFLQSQTNIIIAPLFQTEA
jgi:hypothetical protein